MQISALIKAIDDGEYILPESQRGYVWRREQVSSYVSSLYRGYPTGHFLIWKTKAPPKSRGDQKNAESIYSQLILDGQQRLTSIYSICKGGSPPFYEGESLYFNLYFNIITEEFQFWQPVLMNENPQWISVTEFFKKGLNAFIDDLGKLPAEQQSLYMRELKKFNKLDSVLKYEYHIEVIPKDGQEISVEDVVRIFNLVNSSGTELTKADLALAHICSKWPEAREEIRKTMSETKKVGFNFDIDLYVRIIAGIAIGNTTLEGPFFKTPIEDIKEAWERTKRVLTYVINLLRTEAYIDSGDWLTTPYVLVPLAVFLSNKKAMLFDSEEEKRKFLYWLCQAQIWMRYSRSLDASLQADVNDLKGEHPFEALMNNIRDISGRLTIDPKDLEGKDIRSPLYKMAYVVARSNDAKDWFTGVKMFDKNYGKVYAIQDHHIFPQAVLYEQGGFDSKKSEDVRNVNEIANRAFLSQKANLRAGFKLPENYLMEISEKFPGTLDAQSVPNNKELWKVSNYQQFLEARRELLANNINAYLEGLINNKQGEKEKNAYLDLIKEGESSTLEFKSSFRWDTKEGRVNDALMQATLKNVAGFSNSKTGGTVLLGVSDEKTILGLDQDYINSKPPSRDGLEQLIRRKISDEMGPDLSSSVYVSFHTIDSKDICRIKVPPAKHPVYLKDKNGISTFYLRNGNAVETLNVQQATLYCIDRYGSTKS